MAGRLVKSKATSHEIRQMQCWQSQQQTYPDVHSTAISTASHLRRCTNNKAPRNSPCMHKNCGLWSGQHGGWPQVLLVCSQCEQWGMSYPASELQTAKLAQALTNTDIAYLAWLCSFAIA